MKILYLVPDQNMSAPVAAYARDVAERMSASLHILVVTGDDQAQAAARESYSIAQEALEGLEHSVQFEVGNPVKEMKAELKRRKYALMLLGVRPRQRVIPSQFRLLSQKIIRQADVPVMLVRDGCQSLEKVLVCSGGQEISAPVVELSSKLAGRAGLKATLLTVSPSVPSMYTGMAEIEETMEELLETETPMAQHLRASAELLTSRGIEAEIEIRHGDVVEAILEEANVGGYDLIVLGAAEGMTWRGLLLGNVTQQIINRASSAVLVVKK